MLKKKPDYFFTKARFSWVLLGTLGLAALMMLGVYSGFMSRSVDLPNLTEAKIRQELLKEFEGAYTDKASPNGQVVKFSMDAAESEVEIVPGVKTVVWAYNGQVPGPEIRLKLGETLRLNFKNNLPESTTIHFHGVRVPNAMDGVPGVTQDPIPPGGSFVYEFTPKDAGTFWFHPHVRSAEQVERGLYGILVVEDPADPKYDLDQVMVLDDWRLTKDSQVDSRFMTRMDLMHDGRWGNVIAVNGKLDYKLKIKPGSRLRLRLINTSNGRIYQLYFGRLKAQAVAVDGMKVKETFDPNSYQLAPGNRLDVEILLPKVEDTYVISDVFTRKINNLITIETRGEPTKPDTTEVPLASKVPKWSDALNLPSDKVYYLNARRGGKYGIEWTINDKAYPDYDPVTLKLNSFNKIKFVNQSGRFHPMHLHGQFFKVLTRNGQPAAEPYWRDTVILGPKEEVELGIVPLDEGKWVNHCHILEHAEAGMMTVVKVVK